MNHFSVSFAGSTVTLGCDTVEAQDFLSLLFLDLAQRSGAPDNQRQLSLSYVEAQDLHQLRDGDSLLYSGSLGVRCAAHLYDAVIFHLLDRASAGIALHAGAVVCNGQVILLPGQSGSGKSTLTFWLASRNCSYLTDELIFITLDNPDEIEYFSRPLCLKAGSVHLFRDLLAVRPSKDILMDGHGAVIPHRLLNTEFRKPGVQPSIIVLPAYHPDSKSRLEPISRARLATLLMGCHVNARNLVDHGFSQILDIARSMPACRLCYSTLQDAERLMTDFLPS